MNGINIASSKKDAIRLAIGAGIDMHNFGADFIEPLATLVEEGVFTEERIDRSVRIMLEAKFRLGLFENRYVDEEEAERFLANDEHKQASLEVARKSIVLLKNEKELLPLDDDPGRIFVTGPNADNLSVYGDWVLEQPQRPVTVLEGIRSAVPPEVEVDYYDCGNFGSLDEGNIAIAAIRAVPADVAIVAVGGNAIRYLQKENTLGESEDRTSIDMPGMQTELLQAIHATGTPVVMILLGGRPQAIPWEAENIPAIIEAWEPGMMAGHAVADVLFGKVNPGGRLPFTLLRSVGHIQNYYNHKPSQFFKTYKLSSHDVVYPFGHGLSYTSFSYADLVYPAQVGMKDGSFSISVRVSNTGDLRGDEVVQVYINDLLSSVTQPVKRLVAFQRITLDPGQSQAVTIDIPLERLELVNLDMERVVEPGKFRLMVGSSSRDIRREGIFEVTD